MLINGEERKLIFYLTNFCSNLSFWHFWQTHFISQFYACSHYVFGSQLFFPYSVTTAVSKCTFQPWLLPSPGPRVYPLPPTRGGKISISRELETYFQSFARVGDVFSVICKSWGRIFSHLLVLSRTFETNYY